MSVFSTRRNSFERINIALTGFVFTRVLPIQEAVTARRRIPDLVDYYDKLGVTETINAAGTWAYLTGAGCTPSRKRSEQLACTTEVRAPIGCGAGRRRLHLIAAGIIYSCWRFSANVMGLI
jgi:hypothetical protein